MRTQDEQNALYPPSEWRDDFDWLFREVGWAAPPDLIPRLANRLRGKWGNGPESQERSERLLAAWDYLVTHKKELNTGSALVLAASEHLVSNELVNALYRWFMAIPREQLGGVLDVADVLKAAEEERELMKKRIESAGEN